jgi:hypothetical protein
VNTLERVKKHLIPGRTYRRSELAELSSNVDRHLQVLLKEGLLKKMSMGLYVSPKNTDFGEAPPDELSLLKSFLKDDHFVVYSPSQFNSLGLGSTQLYNSRVVFNRKRTGNLEVGGRVYSFKLWREAPKTLTQEFLVVEFLNRVSELAEDPNLLLENLKSKLAAMNTRKLLVAANRFGTLSTQKKLKHLLQQK